MPRRSSPRIPGTRPQGPAQCPALRLLVVALLALALLLPCEAQAHRVNIFAWLEGENIVVECGFNRSSPVRGGLVTVFDAADGRELLQGRTDDRGLFTFAVPEAVRQGHDLRIEVNAGEGHVNDWTMTAAEVNEAQDLSHGFREARAPAEAPAAQGAAAPVADAAVAGAQMPRAQGAHAQTAPAQNPAGQALTAPEVRAIVAEALGTGLAPIRRELAALSAPGPNVRDIVGGLGWIMGLVGIACFFLSRRRQQKP